MYVFSKWISEFSYKRLLNSFLLNNNRIVVVCLFKFTASPIVLLACIEVLINWIANTHFIKVWNKNILKSGSEISNIHKQIIQSNLNPTSSSFWFVSQTYFLPIKISNKSQTHQNYDGIDAMCLMKNCHAFKEA